MARSRASKVPENWDGICTAKAKGSGKKCTQRAIPPTTKCHYHGGRSLRGPAHHAFKTGERSSFVRAIPKHLRKTFLDVSKRDDIITLRNEIALLETREIELLEQLKEGGSTEFWQDAKKIAAAVEQGDADPSRLIELVTQGAEQWSVWEDILQTIEVRRRLSDTERKRLEMLHAYMTPDQAMAMIGQLVQIIRDVVSDKKQISEIVSRLQSMMPGTPQNQSEVIDLEPVPFSDRALARIEET